MISGIENNIIRSENGNRYLFRLTPRDLEQYTSLEILSLREGLKKELNLLGTNSVLKVYYLDRETILDSPHDTFSSRFFDVAPYTDGLKLFFKGDNFYSNAKFESDYLKLNGWYFRFVYIQLSEDHEIDISDLVAFGDYFVKFQRKKTLFSKHLVDSARKMSHSDLYRALADIEGIETYKENEEMLRRIIKREEELFKAEVFFVVSAKTELDLFDDTTLLIEGLEVKGLAPRIETLGLNNAFRSFFPGLESAFQRELPFHTSLLANSLPTHRDALMEKGALFYSRSGLPLFVDLRAGDSFSLCITGTTGKGKTTFAQKLITGELESGVSVFAFDPKSDYLKLALLYDAHIIAEKINPMMFRNDIYLRNMILSKVPENERTKLWEGRLLSLIRKEGLFLLDDFFRVLDRLSRLGLKDIEFYFEDIREKISTKRMEMNRFAYIDFSTFTDDSIPFLLSFAFEYVKNFSGPHDLIIDECHRVFDHNPVFLEKRVREMRSRNGSLYAISQSFKDFQKTYFGEIVADNCYHKVFFNQPVNESDKISSFDVEKINSLRTIKGEYSEFYYKSEKFRKVLRYYPTRYELEVFSSDSENNKAFFAFLAENSRYFSIDECVDSWVRFKHG